MEPVVALMSAGLRLRLTLPQLGIRRALQADVSTDDQSSVSLALGCKEDKELGLSSATQY